MTGVREDEVAGLELAHGVDHLTAGRDVGCLGVGVAADGVAGLGVAVLRETRAVKAGGIGATPHVGHAAVVPSDAGHRVDMVARATGRIAAVVGVTAPVSIRGSTVVVSGTAVVGRAGAVIGGAIVCGAAVSTVVGRGACVSVRGAGVTRGSAAVGACGLLGCAFGRSALLGYSLLLGLGNKCSDL